MKYPGFDMKKADLGHIPAYIVLMPVRKIFVLGHQNQIVILGSKIIRNGVLGSLGCMLMLREASPDFLIPTAYKLQYGLNP